MHPSFHGRPRSLTEKKKDELCHLICRGASVEEAANTVCVSLRTVQREMKDDENFEHAVKLALREPPDPEKLMRAASRTHWRAAAWLLERENPAKYGRRPAHSAAPWQVETALRCMIEAALDAAAPEQREALYSQLNIVAEATFKCVFPDRGPWGDRRQPTLPSTPLADQASYSLSIKSPKLRVYDRPSADPTPAEALVDKWQRDEKRLALQKAAPRVARPERAWSDEGRVGASHPPATPEPNGAHHATTVPLSNHPSPPASVAASDTAHPAALPPDLIAPELRAKFRETIKVSLDRWLALQPHAPPTIPPSRTKSPAANLRRSPNFRLLSPKTRITTKAKRSDKKKRHAEAHIP